MSKSIAQQVKMAILGMEMSGTYERNEEIYSLHKHNISNVDIAKKYNLTRERVRKILEQMHFIYTGVPKYFTRKGKSLGGEIK